MAPPGAKPGRASVAGFSFGATVVRVIDGDTAVVLTNSRVRWTYGRLEARVDRA